MQLAQPANLKWSPNIEEKVAQALFVDGIFKSEHGVIAGDKVNAGSIAKQVLIGECQVFRNSISISHRSLIKVSTQVNTQGKGVELVVVYGFRKVKTGFDQLKAKAIFLNQQLLSFNDIELVSTDKIRVVTNASNEGIGLIRTCKPACT